ncbi:hypothetical protein K469DRAFT_579083 [Zopfia rhizophila CBS 207.26]|uniref:Uncharacterized protein n=1 Tax=Zopfia rhizophila CBS 207.26 TaxID=1314779 RepID=A0A6A6E0D0_9PEZI|nr:hypothetical protein K469DRAFT_579083 [Zopfia rhizophila CBS 207.26]
MPRIPVSSATQYSRFVCPQFLAPRVLARYSSGSPTPASKPANTFNKTGEREDSDPKNINIRTDEYSKSGGDDIVAEQAIAAFESSKDTDPFSQKERAGKGNIINPLEVSPADPEASKIVEEKVVEKNVEGKKAKSGKGITKKAKKVERVEIDFDKIKMRGR